MVCSSVFIVNNFYLGYVVSLDKFFNKFEEINLLDLEYNFFFIK